MANSNHVNHYKISALFIENFRCALKFLMCVKSHTNRALQVLLKAFYSRRKTEMVPAPDGSERMNDGGSGVFILHCGI